MSAHLPSALQDAIAHFTETIAPKDIASRSVALTDRYRGGSGSEAIRDERDVAAYLIARLPATYAAISSVLEAAKERAPRFQPRRLLDVGAGPGTASWAAADLWPELQSITMLDRNPLLLAVARTLAHTSPHPALTAASFVGADVARYFPADLLEAANTETTSPNVGRSERRRASARGAPGGGHAAQPSEAKTYDLIIAAYTLAELPAHKLDHIVSALWAACTGMLVIVEPGTPSGYARVLAARTRLITQGGRIVAPCPGAYPCPIAAPDWCHFAARLPRSRAHMRAKGARVPFEDEKFSYLAIAREGLEVQPAEARILAPPVAGKPGLRLRLCTDGKIIERTVLKRDAALYRAASRKKWGDAL